MQDEQTKPGWTFSPGQGSAPSNDDLQQQPSVKNETNASDISWTASEFVDHQKTGGWYVLYILGAAVIIAAIYLFTQDIFTLVVLVVSAIIFAIYAGRRPRTLPYHLTNAGIQV